jgi:low affinity Fe/Cu permease
MATTEPSRINRIGRIVSDLVANGAAHPVAQIAVLAFCVAWFALGLSTNVLSAAMAIVAILLTQMVLNKQKEREADAHRRDVAMHAKLDELLIASIRARSTMAGIEHLEEDQIAEIAQRADEELERAPGD